MDSRAVKAVTGLLEKTATHSLTSTEKGKSKKETKIR